MRKKLYPEEDKDDSLTGYDEESKSKSADVAVQ
jgi:hypothetical protein